jgi:nucleoside-triphosphatase
VTNLLITGLPRSGKTTLIKKTLQTHPLAKKAGGFFTQEFRKNGTRVGFHIITIPEGRKGLMSQKGISSPYRVGRYGVNINVLEELGCQAIVQAKATGNIIVVDEVGKMELFSKKFQSTLIDALNSTRKVLATIMERPDVFADRIKKRPDIRLLFLTRDNFEEVFKQVLIWLDK